MKTLQKQDLVMIKPGGNRKLWLLILIPIVCAIVFFAYRSSLQSTAFCFDDNEYLSDNTLVKNPGIESVKRFFTEVFRPSSVRGYYQPLTMVSLMIDYALGGRDDNLFVFRLTNLCFHIANTALVVVFFSLLFGRIGPAALIGLLFGLHPLNADSVVWLAERKTLLAGFFSFLSLIFYLSYTGGKRNLFLWTSIVSYILAILSKPTCVMLPFLLLLLDYWPLKRLDRKAVIEKTGFFVFFIMSAIVTFVSQSRAATVAMPTEFSPWRAPLIFCHNLTFYICKTFWPTNLTPWYAYPTPLTISQPAILWGVIGTLILFGLLILSLRKTKIILHGWLFFFIAILPTLGFITFTAVIAANKYMYIPLIGFLLPIAAFLCNACPENKVFRPSDVKCLLILAAVIIAAGAEFILTTKYLHNWQDTETLHRYMIKIEPDEAPLHNNLADALQKQDKIVEAADEYVKTLQLDPNHFGAENNLAIMLGRQNKLDEAISHFQKALTIKPDYKEAAQGLRYTTDLRNNLDNEITKYKDALRQSPDNPNIMSELGFVLAERGKYTEAQVYYRKSLKINPASGVTYARLGALMVSLKSNAEAIKEFKAAAVYMPNDAEIHYFLGTLLEKEGKKADAIAEYQKALSIDPKHSKAEQSLRQLEQELKQGDNKR